MSEDITNGTVGKKRTAVEIQKTAIVVYAEKP